ncbi:MAG: Methionyl-tRNA formyltransferase [Acidimicrobiaceae bacterium]|nr:Methionyl-tRNA formyltransferase [Acidimicrobiaceae bacterium]
MGDKRANPARRNGARLALFTVIPNSYRAIDEWAQRADYSLALVVTTPAAARTGMLAAIDDQAVVVVSNHGRDAAEVLGRLGIDLGLISGFGRLSAELGGLPRAGTVNLHPSLLPDYRGPNGYRSVYDGADPLGYTLHRIVDQFDAGPILAQASSPLPEVIDPESIDEVLQWCRVRVLDEGVVRALDGETGTEQTGPTDRIGSRFGEQDATLRLDQPASVLALRVAALSLTGAQPYLVLDDEARAVRRVDRVDDLAMPAGRCHWLGAGRALVAAADGALLDVHLGALIS